MLGVMCTRAALLGALLLGACKSAPPPPSQAEIARAQDALKPLKQGLRQALQSAMAGGGPVAAVEVCAAQAPSIAAAATRPGVALGRTSHRLRNPENAPRPWAEPLLEAYRGETRASAPPHRAVRLGEQGVGYVEPIWVEKPCLTCHGETVAPEVASLIATRYPKDAARGFREGDFRGLFWVELTPP
jgi:hypothetical protein